MLTTNIHHFNLYTFKVAEGATASTAVPNVIKKGFRAANSSSPWFGLLGCLPANVFNVQHVYGHQHIEIHNVFFIKAHKQRYVLAVTLYYTEVKILTIRQDQWAVQSLISLFIPQLPGGVRRFFPEAAH